ncbi:enoyl-CoA hydratase/isomerase family protein [Dokdonella sp.]|uniref:enoyl-CoA hydratase/isomerase family protein n=1 Tax=Dokdonella sp. TaxID=2291710 RepID=UPI0025B98309|nr:enoyl-CoA hydratase/isomerase family protein [Dokdonella sp.]MBX3690011.1 enoyl-CoA hydratase/isomerase family protein [Dokdonella sp.]
MLDLIRHDRIHELRLARPPVNALDPALVRALRSAIEAATEEGARALMLSGAPGMFSAGLDVPTLLQLDRAAMRAFWVDFFDLCAALARCPIPVAAAITGHSPAGGAVLAILCDYRVMAHSIDPAKPFRIGLNEVQVGLVVPEVIQIALRRLVGAYRAERLMVAGAMISAEQAQPLGFVDELVEISQVVERARNWLDELLALPPHALAATRLLARADLAAAFADPSTFGIDDFVEAWFAPQTQAVLQALVARLKK